MTLRLRVESGAWETHISDTARTLGAVLPVVKGNGYGFGRSVLMSRAAALSSDVAVGTVHELGDVPPTMRPFVLTPVGVGVSTIPRPDAVLTVGSQRDLQILAALHVQNPVVIKVESSMHRYGIASNEAASLRHQAETTGHQVVAWSLHLPLDGSDDDRVTEVQTIAGALAPDIPLQISHVGGAFSRLRTSLPHSVTVRAGTQLWLGDKSMLALHADVIAVRQSSAASAGYRSSRISPSARLVMVGCGSSHGVSALDDGRSPFHFANRRLDMLEPPHMHTTMLAVADGSCPVEGDWVDVQQPLTRVQPDVIEWR
jgi:alanine racemase